MKRAAKSGVYPAVTTFAASTSIRGWRIMSLVTLADNKLNSISSDEGYDQDND
jgi:hypothetical protein